MKEARIKIQARVPSRRKMHGERENTVKTEASLQAPPFCLDAFGQCNWPWVQSL